MKKHIFKFVSLILGLFFIFIGFTTKDYSFFVIAGLFILFPLFQLIPMGIFKIKIKTLTKLKKSRKKIVSKKDNYQIKTLVLISIPLLIYFVIIGIYFLSSYQQSKIGLLQYYLSLLSFLSKHLIITIPILILALLLSFVIFKKKWKIIFSFSWKRLFTFIFSVFISFFLSLVFILLISAIQILTIGILSRVNPNFISITTDTDQIKEKIKNSDNVPFIVGSDNDSRTLIVENSNLIWRTSQFYNKNLLNNLPKNVFSIIKNPNSPIFFYKNYLVIKTIDKDIIQKISPLVSKKIIGKYFDTKYIRDEANVEVISRQDYLKYRDDQFNKQLKEIQSLIDDIKKQIRFVNSKVAEAKSSISTLQEYIIINTRYRDEEYSQCISETYTYYGYYSNYSYRRNSDQYCNQLKDNRNAQNEGYQNSINEFNQNLVYYQGQAYSLNQDFSDLDDYSNFVESAKSQTPYELGLFEPPQSIKVVLESTSNKAIGDYFAILTHEYLHYTSYISEERTLPLFFEEGLTELLSRNSIKESLKINTNIGYPLITKIMDVISSKIDKDILSQIYFTKDVNLLESTLDDKFGKNFYKDTESFFTLIPYLPSDKALKLANNIMYRIEGPELTEKDIYSSESNY